MADTVETDLSKLVPGDLVNRARAAIQAKRDVRLELARRIAEAEDQIGVFRQADAQIEEADAAAD